MHARSERRSYALLNPPGGTFQDLFAVSFFPFRSGRAATPTPLGRFFINADIPQSNALGAYGPLILSVSSYSEVLATFDGGLPAIGLHGTNQPSLVGQAMSNGCIRMPNDAVLALAALVPIGTPVDFVA